MTADIARDLFLVALVGPVIIIALVHFLSDLISGGDE